MPDTRVGAIVGPTAVGKSEVSLAVAEKLGAEIVSVDSMQVYRGMDVGTAKVTPQERRGIPHHLLDLKDPSEEVTVAEFRDLARAAIADISGRGKLPLLVGGSGLYFRAVVDDLDFPARSTDVRATLEQEAETLGAEVLHARLSEIDPKAAAKIEPGNARRTIRALEAIEVTGRLFSDNDAWDTYVSVYDLRVAGLTRSRDDLFARIEKRIDAMLSDGLEAEAKALVNPSRTARQALGYRQILDMADAPVSDVRDEIVRATKRFARRQESWFKADPRVRWLPADATDVSETVADHLASSNSWIEGA
ncbi:MAG: tRNA (adenosine(37)-N6)-dimethylallyltransferase MiaA [Actinomycetota bacterium]|nr:tRNA (adenosine(37)-N6)-dimethylallyltransferase MiaA [Actinomycetota bacterium]